MSLQFSRWNNTFSVNQQIKCENGIYCLWLILSLIFICCSIIRINSIYSDVSSHHQYRLNFWRNIWNSIYNRSMIYTCVAKNGPYDDLANLLVWSAIEFHGSYGWPDCLKERPLDGCTISFTLGPVPVFVAAQVGWHWPMKKRWRF